MTIGSSQSDGAHKAQIPGPIPILASMDGQALALALIDAYPHPAWIIDEHGTVSAVNVTASNLRIQGAIAALAQETRNAGRSLIRRITLANSGEEGATALELTALNIGDPATGAVAILGRDLTGEHNLTAALVASRELYRDLVQCSADFAWETNGEGEFTYLSVRSALGFTADDLMGRPGANLLHSSLNADPLNPFTTREALDGYEVFVTGSDGDERLMEVYAVPVMDSDGNYIGARGSCRDITLDYTRRTMLDRVSERSRIIEGVIEAMRSAPEPGDMLIRAVHEMAAAIGRDVWLLRCNHSGVWYAAAGPGTNFTNTPFIPQDLGRAMEQAERNRTQEWRIEGARFLFHATTFGEQVNGALVFAQDDLGAPMTHTAIALIDALAAPLGIAIAQAEQVERLEQLSSIDELTGLLNRRAFIEAAELRILMGRRQARAAVFIYLDLDNFKPINDQLGHQTGDTVLRKLGQLLLRSGRNNDLIVRLGGDEFGLWLDATDLEGAVNKAEMLIRMIPALAPEMPPSAAKFGVSIGIAVVTPGPENLAGIMARADAALYEAKRAGRSTWRVAAEPVYAE
jgi:diguanylate cyclase (GGDEF)-like protein/PAS domain S-box-containing protein